MQGLDIRRELGPLGSFGEQVELGRYHEVGETDLLADNRLWSNQPVTLSSGL